MKLQRLNLTDIKELEEFLSYFGVPLSKQVIQTLNDPSSFAITDDKFECLAMYLPITSNVYNAHAYKKPNVGGSRIKKFICIAGHYLMTVTDCNNIINLVDTDHKHLMMLMGSVGSKNMGLMKKAMNGRDAIMYNSSKDDLYNKVEEQYKEVITWV